MEIKIRENRKTIDKVNEAKSWFFEEITKVDKPLARMIRGKRKKRRNNENDQYQK